MKKWIGEKGEKKKEKKNVIPENHRTGGKLKSVRIFCKKPKKGKRIQFYLNFLPSSFWKTERGMKI